ncbi:unnamed protein product [Orchesella dallaii]|uniref:Uncharacterized protein n=1 Tax=Orchesella dallaii TaxID=48710 RepID=A0ABP1QFU6_9HEXA
MSAIIKLLLKEDPHLYNEEELSNVIDKYCKDSSFIVFGGKTRAYEFVVDHGKCKTSYIYSFLMFYQFCHKLKTS